MADMKKDQERYLREMESKVEILENENAQLAERGEDTLLLGIVSEHINQINDVDELLHTGLEKISLLKNIPFCAVCQSEQEKFLIDHYYFLQSNDALLSTEFVFQEDVRESILADYTELVRCEGDHPCPVIKFESLDFFPCSMLLIPARYIMGESKYFCFAESENKAKLSQVTPLLERVVEMICSRIDMLTLLQSLKELNRDLDKKVREKTEELALANQILRKNEKKFRGLFDNAVDMIHFVDEHRKLVDANQAELETLQYSKEEYLNLDPEDVVDKEYRAATKEALDRVSRGEEIRSCQTVLVAKDGSRIEVEVNAVPEMDGDKVVGSMAIIRDISERKKIEEQLLKIRKMESIGVLAGGIAHDFNNILAAILGNISLAMQYAEPEGKVYSLLSGAEKASVRAKELTRQLLTFSKGGDPVKQISSIADVIKDSAGFVLRGTNVRCSYTFADDLWPVTIDRGQISQVIQNLVINSRHAMPSGGEVNISCENFPHEQAHLLPVSPGRYVKLSIEDMGTGIPVDHIDKIFDPYFTTKQDGSGLGLAVTHSVILKHKGHIEVASRHGQGTVFTVYLPASDTPPDAAKPVAKQKQWSGKGKILIMDDDEMIRDIATEMLSHVGYEVVAACNGEEAIEIIKKDNDSSAPIATVILDLTIPGGMGGKEAAGIIRGLHPDINLIVSSGYSNDPVMADHKKYGFCAAIVKPYKLQELMDTLEHVYS